MKTAQFSDLLSREMSRKEFIFYVGMLCLAITGISGLLKTLSDPSFGKNRSRVTKGFGGGPYGV